mgnify:CR=1 FL=1
MFNQKTLAKLHFTLDNPAFYAVVIAPTRIGWKVSSKQEALEATSALLASGVSASFYKEATGPHWMLEVTA